MIVLLLIAGARKAGFSRTRILSGGLIFAGTAFPVLGVWNYTAFDFCDRYSLLITAVTVGFTVLILSKIHCRKTLAAAMFFILIAVHFCQGSVYLLFWEDTPQLMDFALAQNSRASRAALSAGLSSGLRTRNLLLLKHVSKSMHRNLPELAEAAGNPVPVHGGMAFVDAQVAHLSGNMEEYVKQTFIAWDFSVRSGGLFYWDTLQEAFCKDMIFACRYTGNEEDARRIEEKLKKRLCPL